jgi:DNA polymerase-3 subunit delta'
MEFKDVIGQTEVKQHLREMVDQNRLSHALIFLGKEGSGALPLALAFSTYLIEQSEKNAKPSTTSLFGEAMPNETSGEGVRQAKKYIHPDVHYSYPVIPKKVAINQSAPTTSRNGGILYKPIPMVMFTTGYN